MTPRELFIYSLNKQRSEWDHTAQLQAFMHNMLSKKKKISSDFHPLPRGGVKKKAKDLSGVCHKGLSLAEFKEVIKREESQ